MIINLLGIFFLALITFQARVLYLIFFANGKMPKKGSRIHPAKTLIILGSGGHTAEMLRIVSQIDLKNYSPRIYVQARTDQISGDKVKELELDNKDYRIVQIYRSREVRQSYITAIWTTTVAILDSIPVLWKEKPDLILCNGPGTCIPLCMVAFFLKIFFICRTKIVFIESFCRVKTFSLTGKILYYIADFIIVQWPYLKNMFSAPVTTSSIPWEALTNDIKENSPSEIKVHLISILVKLKYSYENSKKLTIEWVENSLLRIEACLDRTWEMLNSGYWKNVPIQYRYCYSYCTILKSILLEIQYESRSEKSADKQKILEEIIKQVDKGILLGAPPPCSPNLLTSMASKLNNLLPEETLKTENYKTTLINNEEISKILLPGFAPVTLYNEPSMETFYREIFMPKIPAVLEGCMKHWKALELWQNPDYLIRIAGIRTVPIEIGSRYTEEDWTQHLISFSDFIRSHICGKSDKVGYLAQHQLFEQIPELKDDFAIPDYCNFSDTEDEASIPDINVWFGPNGTVSPLHYDPKNNLLCQVFGYKRIILYSPEDSLNLYPYDTRLLSNTAQVDPMNPEFEKWPNFKKAKGSLCYLGPGEMLFIPPGWWHHVVGLTPSFSISFWWN
ncbi:jmjC domain-containing protein 5 isoform X2 [Cephus cinctus]|nr:jmjC domain-containing protein 5 isoform X2 [Cephus cinctus]XP_015589896.1 jmjC domain-containing protein 5 isoform X2 [Cephus cinctus]XP_015589897.1 jmjC domain-containing protein 5 isoform X2 [Cephus cinctus]